MKVKFTIGAAYTEFRFIDTPASDIAGGVALIDCVTMARPDGYRFMPAYKAKRWDGYIRLRVNNTFPTGLLDIVIGAVKDAFMVDVEHTHELPEYDSSMLRPDVFDGITARDYQVDACEKLLLASRGIAKMATNSGKTLIIAMLCAALSSNVLIMTTKKEILYQTAQRMETRLNESIGIVGDGKWDVERVTVAMAQTLTKNLDRLDEVDAGCVIFDECHHIPSKTAQDVLLGISAPYRFGLSGTPLRYKDLNDLILIGSTGPVLVDITNADLIAMGVSAKPTVHMHSVVSDLHYTATYQVAYASCIVDNDVRNEYIADALYEHEFDSALILVDRIAHGMKLLDIIDNAVFVHGSDLVDDRLDALDMLRAGDGAIVIAAPIFDEGVDVPSVDLLILAGGGKGHIKLLQRIGRGMRKKVGHNVLHVVDFIDDTNKYLLQHSLARCELYESEGFQVVVENE